MRRFVNETDLDSVDLRDFHRILIATDTANYIGEEIKSDLRLPQFVSATSPAPEVVTNELLITVEDPENSETVERIKRYVANKLADL